MIVAPAAARHFAPHRHAAEIGQRRGDFLGIEIEQPPTAIAARAAVR